MALVPTIEFAEQHRLPEDRTQGLIIPRVWIWHTFGVAGTPEAVQRYYSRPDVVTEAHGATGLDGRAHQWLDTARRADHAVAANGFAIGWENEDAGVVDRPFTPQQVETNARLAVWGLLHHGIPLEVVTSSVGSGHGWHNLYASWNPNHHGCPGTARARQVVTEILPRARVLLRELDPAAPPPTHAEDNDVNRTCHHPTLPRQPDGRVPTYRWLSGVDPTRVRVLGYNGAPLYPAGQYGGLTVTAGEGFGVPYIDLAGLAAPVSGIGPTRDGVVLDCDDGGSIDVAAPA
jgi:hypothetical protein